MALEETGARGLIQGDSFSPLLFVFVLEAMGRVLSTVINRGLLDGFSVGSAAFSHLLFVDDALMFYDALTAYLRHL